MIRFATIGTNVITDRFLEAAEKVPGLEFSGVYSRELSRAKAFADQYGVSLCYDGLEQLAQDRQVDAVYIASPNCFHYEQAMLLMQAGKHVLCEKPISSNQVELRNMIQMAEDNKVVLLEAMRSVFDPGFTALKEMLPKVGKIRQVTLAFCQYSSRYDNYKKGIIENAFRWELSNGALMDIGVYCVHLLIALFGKPDNVLADSIFLTNGAEGAGTILARYPEFQAQLIYSKICNNSLPCQIQGEAGTILFEKAADIRKISLRFPDQSEEEFQIDKYENNMVYEAQTWLECIESKVSCGSYLQNSLDTLSVMDAIRKQTGTVFPADDLHHTQLNDAANCNTKWEVEK